MIILFVLKRRRSSKPCNTKRPFGVDGLAAAQLGRGNAGRPVLRLWKWPSAGNGQAKPFVKTLKFGSRRKIMRVRLLPLLFLLLFLLLLLLWSRFTKTITGSALFERILLSFQANKGQTAIPHIFNGSFNNFRVITGTGNWTRRHPLL